MTTEPINKAAEHKTERELWIKWLKKRMPLTQEQQELIHEALSELQEHCTSLQQELSHSHQKIEELKAVIKKQWEDYEERVTRIIKNLKDEKLKLEAENEKLREALKGLMSNPMINLGDKIYEVRDREGKGWDGPHVVQWGKAVETARKLIEG